MIHFDPVASSIVFGVGGIALIFVGVIYSLVRIQMMYNEQEARIARERFAVKADWSDEP